ncbi:peptidoglycan-binding protein [Sinobaca sp. H24]|uniref:peptidoglycan-binding domain-containing protein n=1 Tax=Sinobaca sp. H24 TaxID=2923376 RepID=UPI002079DACC|nr:peptidoglycan-binding domain-containing protein [Sinobaca sp. H24]
MKQVNLQDQTVINIQDKLRNMNYLNSVSTGHYGPMTTEAVRQFQADFGLRQMALQDRLLLTNWMK